MFNKKVTKIAFHDYQGSSFYGLLDSIKTISPECNPRVVSIVHIPKSEDSAEHWIAFIEVIAQKEEKVCPTCGQEIKSG